MVVYIFAKPSLKTHSCLEQVYIMNQEVQNRL